LPTTLSGLIEDLSANDAPGAQGFLELHAARNQAQPQGILPAPDQLPRWIDETAALSTFLVQRCFGVELSSVGSAAAVTEERLARLLNEAEEAIEDGDTTLAFRLSWQAIQDGLVVFRRHTGLAVNHRAAPLGGNPMTSERSKTKSSRSPASSSYRYLRARPESGCGSSSDTARARMV
jgi:hypothetical protein